MQNSKNKINRLLMGQLVNVILAIDKAHTASQRAMNYGLGLGGINQVYGPNCPTPTAYCIDSI